MSACCIFLWNVSTVLSKVELPGIGPNKFKMEPWYVLFVLADIRHTHTHIQSPRWKYTHSLTHTHIYKHTDAHTLIHSLTHTNTHITNSSFTECVSAPSPKPPKPIPNHSTTSCALKWRMSPWSESHTSGLLTPVDNFKEHLVQPGNMLFVWTTCIRPIYEHAASLYDNDD